MEGKPARTGRFHGAGLLARHDLAQMLRQRETLLWVFLMPLLFFYFVGTVTGGFGAPADPERRDPLALVAPADEGFLLPALTARLAAEGFDVGPPPAGESPPRRLVRVEVEGELPPSEAVLAGDGATVRLVRRGAGPAAERDRFRVARAVYGTLLDLAVVRAAGEAVTAESLAAVREAERPIAIDEHPAGARAEPPSGFEQAVPGTLVMFTMLVLLSSGAVLLVQEREQGLLARLAAAPIPPRAIVAAKWLSRMALGLVQIAFGVAAGTFLFGVEWGDAPWAVALVLFAWAAFNASLALWLAGVARTTGQAVGVSVAGSMVLAALGGCWWPIEVTPPWMQALARALPTGWTMDALHRLAAFGRPPAEVLPHVLALLLGAALLGRLATARFRYR